MKIVGVPKLEAFKKKHPEVAPAIDTWRLLVKRDVWETPHDLKSRWSKASVIGKTNVVFNIRGNAYRLWVTVAYKSGVVVIQRAGTHKEYDKWNIS